MSFEEIQKRAEAAGQGHLFKEWPNLSPQEKDTLVADIQRLDFEGLNATFQATMHSTEMEDEVLQPATDVLQLKNMMEEDKSRWRAMGLDLIGSGKVAVLILSGGQGTRLGSNKPKGCYDVGLPSKSPLFQLHAERIQRIQYLANAQKKDKQETLLRLYLMTSIHTHEHTIQFFTENDFFGLDPDQVSFFQQGLLPCFTEDGKVILETASKMAMSPNGNGGVYAALRDSGCLEEMERLGIECVDCFSVDNLLAKAADPLFLGYCWESAAPCGGRVVSKTHPEEKVGVFVTSGGRTKVVEYSELSSEMARAREPSSNQLQFNWGNICMHYFRVFFLEKADKMPLPYHIARKRIPSCGTDVQGIKLERFIFDVFPFAASVCLMEVERASEHAPVKNAPGSEIDSPDTGRKALLGLHKRWIEAEGGVIPDGHTVEISPLLSYEGEDLARHCSGKTFADMTVLGPSAVQE